MNQTHHKYQSAKRIVVRSSAVIIPRQYYLKLIFWIELTEPLKCSLWETKQKQVIFEEIVNSLLANPPTDLLAHPTVKDYCLTLDGRQSGWKKLSSERDPKILARLLFYWLLHLKHPVFTNDELSNVVVYADKPAICLSRFDLVKFVFQRPYSMHRITECLFTTRQPATLSSIYYASSSDCVRRRIMPASI